MDITFATNGRKDCTQVFAKINTGLPVENCVLHFEWECGHQHAAALLVTYLQKELAESIRAAHRTAYLQGWHDAKNKKRKKSWFPSCFVNDSNPCG